MNKKKDPRTTCTNCESLYGMERPGMQAIRNSRNFIALTKDNPNRPSLIMIVPKVHKEKVMDIKRILADEAQNFIAEVLEYLENKFKGKVKVKAFQVMWKDGAPAINFTQSFAHLKTHAHAEILITY